jgi:hypothetical protein
MIEGHGESEYFIPPDPAFLDKQSAPGASHYLDILWTFGFEVGRARHGHTW